MKRFNLLRGFGSQHAVTGAGNADQVNGSTSFGGGGGRTRPGSRSDDGRERLENSPFDSKPSNTRSSNNERS
ncbi:MAG: hypothetical protein KF851_07320 [Pirellulaceae bacterium]|nr:hypothetical protein [Pirellulaceae bacterium]